MKSEVHVESKDGKMPASIRSAFESAVADYMWRHPEHFCGMEEKTLEFNITVKFGKHTIGPHNTEVS